MKEFASDLGSQQRNLEVGSYVIRWPKGNQVFLSALEQGERVIRAFSCSVLLRYQGPETCWLLTSLPAYWLLCVDGVGENTGRNSMRNYSPGGTCIYFHSRPPEGSSTNLVLNVVTL